MKKLYSTVHIWRMPKPLSLEDIFMDLDVLYEQSAFRPISNKALLEKLYQGLAEFGRLDLEQMESERKNALDAVQENQKLVILGRPGAGKTTFLKHITLQALAGELEYIPIFILLRTFAESNEFSKLNESLFEFITRQFEICGFPDAGSFINTVLKKGKAIILCDGLDEVSEASGIQKKVIRKLTEFINEYGENRFVITCRVAATEYFFENFQYVEIADLNEVQIRGIVTNWFKCTENPFLAEDKAKRFIEACHRTKRQPLIDLAKNPLFLTLLCIAYEDEEAFEFPARRSEIYEEALSALLRKWDSTRGIVRGEIYHKLFLNRKHQMFARIAAETFERREYLIKQRQLENRIVHYLQNLPPIGDDEDINGTAIIKAIEAQHGIFVEQAHQLYSFSHISFQQYYTAKYIVDNVSKGTLKRLIQNHFSDEIWHEVFLLTAEMLDDAEEFFKIFLSVLDDLIEKDKKFLLPLFRNIAQGHGNTKHVEIRITKIYVFLDISYIFAYARVLEHILDFIYVLDKIRTCGSAHARNRALKSALNSNLIRSLNIARLSTLSLECAVDFILTLILNPAFDSARALRLNPAQAADLADAFKRASDSTPARALDLALAYTLAAAHFYTLNAARRDILRDVIGFTHTLDNDLARDLITLLDPIPTPASDPNRLAYRVFDHAHDFARTPDITESYNAALKLSKKQENADFHQVFARLSLPCQEEAPFKEWHTFSNDLLKIIQDYRIFDDYKLTEEQIQHLMQYLESTQLLLDCLNVAYVSISNRTAIVDHLFRP